MYLDDLPIWGIVGEIDDKAEDYYVWTHKKFEIGYNNDQVGLFEQFCHGKNLFDLKIVDVNLTSEGRTKLQLGESLAFSYEVIWKKQSTLFEVIFVDQIF